MCPVLMSVDEDTGPKSEARQWLDDLANDRLVEEINRLRFLLEQASDVDCAENGPRHRLTVTDRYAT